jgi:hypothetical protein
MRDESAIQDALASGVPDEEIVATIMRETNSDETTARQILAMEKGLPREEWDDVITLPAEEER